MSDKRFILLHEHDNVFVCCQRMKAADTVNIEGHNYVLQSDINVGHKLARIDIAEGEKIIKYGVSIGSATTAIVTGEHVHLNNIKSDYIASHTRESKVGEH
ncbi:MAG: UxaA family hydrolase [Gammaproteobacteria bacterium]|nr:UxaA family hydrolase [Gammaproteobacteria bacterium]